MIASAAAASTFVLRREAQLVEALFAKLCAAPLHRFPECGVHSEAPCAHGVYVITNARGIALHVGRTVSGKKGLSQRLADHLRGTSSFAWSYLRNLDDGVDGMTMLRRSYRFRFLAVDDPRQRALLEALAIGRLCPLHLGLGKIFRKRQQGG